MFVIIMRLVFGHTHQIDAVVRSLNDLEMQRWQVNDFTWLWQLTLLGDQQTGQGSMTFFPINQLMIIQ